MADGATSVLLPTEDPEEVGAVRAVESSWHVARTPRRRDENSCWRRAFKYNENENFAVSLEISLRGAVCLVLFSIPTILGMASDDESWFHKNNWRAAIFHTGGILTFVYTLAPTSGRTIGNAGRAVSGTLTAAAFSLLMYLVYPDGCIGAEPFEFCYFFGVLAGAASIICCLLLDLGTSFHLFYLSNFVWFWMAFLDPSPEDSNGNSRMRTTMEDKDKIVLNWCGGFAFAEWGGGVFKNVCNSAVGASMAIIATLLPFPMTSMDRARDCAFETVKLIEKTWSDAVDFYVADDRDEWRAARMARDLRAVKEYTSTLKERLDNSFWERYLLRPWCFGRSWRLKHLYLTELEATTSRCLGILNHVSGACMREKFEDVHDEMMKPERCGNAIGALVNSANALLSLALQYADDGDIGEGEREELQREADGVKKAEAALSRQMWESLATVNEDAVNRLMENPGTKDSDSERIKDEQFINTALDLTDEQVFMFCLCHFANCVHGYSTWLAENDGVHSTKGTFLTPVKYLSAGLRNAFSKDAIMAPANVNYALRHSLAIFIGFAIGYVGYSEMIRSRKAIIPSTIAVLVSQSTSAPIDKSLSRLLGVVLGKFSGQLAYALLGWCAAWAQVSLSTVVFAYVWLTLFICHYSTGMFSYLGLLAAAFGTKQFLGGDLEAGCSDKVVTPAARNLVAMMIAIMIMSIVDNMLKLGSPSDLAYVAYLDALVAWRKMLKDLLTDEDTRVDPVQITTFIDKAVKYGHDAEAEPRYWRPPFPAGIFSEMIGLAKTMRTQVICIHEVICEKSKHEGGTFSKTEWYKKLVAGKGWQAEISSLLAEIETTHDVIVEMAGRTGNTVPKGYSEKVNESDPQISKMELLKFTSRSHLAKKVEMGERTPSLVDDEVEMMNFVYGSVQTIKAANHKLQLDILKKGV